LDLTNSLVLELLDFFKCAADHAKSLRVNSSRCQNLVGLRVLGLQVLLDGLKLLLHDQVTKASLAMDVVDDAVELFEKLFLFILEVLELLEAHLVLPLHGLVILLGLHNFPLLASEFFADHVVLNLQLLQASDLLPDVLKRFHDHIVSGVLEVLLAVGGGLSPTLELEVSSEGADHVHVEARDVVVVVVDILVLLLVLGL